MKEFIEITKEVGPFLLLELLKILGFMAVTFFGGLILFKLQRHIELKQKLKQKHELKEIHRIMGKGERYDRD